METYRGGSTNQGLRRLLRKYAEGGSFPEPALRDEATYGPDTTDYRRERAQATSDAVNAALAKSSAAMAARPMEPDLMGYQTRQAPEGYWYDDAGFMRNAKGEEITPERRPSIIPFDKYGDFTNSKLLELAGNLSGGILAPVRGAQGAFLLGSGPVRKAVEVAAQQVPRELSPLGFYSHGAETAANLAQAKGAPDQMTAMLRKYGVKPDELYNAGIADETATNVMRSKIEREYAPKLAAAKLEMDALGLNENTINKKSPDYNKALDIRQSPETKAKYQYDSALNAMRSDMDSAMVLHPEWSARPSVTREELAKYFNERRPQVEETVLGAKANKYPYRDADEWQTAINQAERRRDFDEAERLTLAWEELDGIGAQGAPKFQKHTLPGGENYREVLLKMPNPGDALNARRLEIEKIGAAATPEQRQEWADIMNRLRPDSSDVEGVQKYKNFPEFRSQHWDDPNVLAHLRMADRTGPNGEKILHVEEIQSDWGQKGKKEGFKNPQVEARQAEIENALNQLRQEKIDSGMALERKFTEDTHEFNAEYRRLMGPAEDAFISSYVNRDTGAMEAYNAASDKVMGQIGHLLAPHEKAREAAHLALQKEISEKMAPLQKEFYALPKVGSTAPAPYVTNTAAWTDLALKRALKEAAEGGYDRLVWTPGAEQAKRYPEGGPKREEGMKGYYDKIVPNQLSKLVKKLDPEAKIGRDAIGSGKYEVVLSNGKVIAEYPEKVSADIIARKQPGATVRQNGLEVPSLTITPKMREAIMKGQTDFARGGAVQGYAKGGPANNSLEALYRKYAEPTMRQRTRARYAEGGPVSSAAIYDPAEIDALAASIIEGNYA